MFPKTLARAGPALVLMLLFGSCGGKGRGSGETERSAAAWDAPELEVTSTAFQDGGPIPAVHACDGEDASPPLAWSGVPAGCGSLALICEDPDAPRGIWVHWVVYNLPPDSTGLGQGVPAAKVLPDGSRQGLNDFGRTGYAGPCPPPGGPHRYVFKLYALDARLDLEGDVRKDDLVRAMEGHILGEGRLVGTYERR